MIRLESLLSPTLRMWSGVVAAAATLITANVCFAQESEPVIRVVAAPTQVLQGLEEPAFRTAAGHGSVLTHQITSQATPSVAPATSKYAPWWESEVAVGTRGAQTVPVGVNELLMSALRSSAQIKVFSDLPLIRETAITEADAAFDWTGFLEYRWDDTNEPVGNTLTTGGPSRFEDQRYSYSFGSRRRNTVGGQFEASQQMGFQQNNSVFFLPNNQGTSRLTFSYTQPMLRGAGRAYNTSLTVLAQIDSKIARDEFSRQLQSHLLEVTRSYWSLYLERAALLQKRRLLKGAEDILAKLEQRQELDTVNSQVAKARSAVASRRSEILRSEMAVKNAESRIRSLTNDPAWGCGDEVELVPADVPFRHFVSADMTDAVCTAMRSRPEVSQSIKQIKAACVRMNMAKNEILPMLNLVLESYLVGLRGNRDIGGAWTDQFTEGDPSYSVGLQYEFPIWNRAAKARLQRRRLEVRQLQNQFQTTAETLKLEVAVAVRELETSFKEMEAKHRAMTAAGTEVEYIMERWEALGSEDRSASLMLEDLLNAQGRLADAEFGFLNSGLTYNLAQMNYKKAVGTLLQDEAISVSRNCQCCLPGQTVGKSMDGTCVACQQFQASAQTVPQQEVYVETQQQEVDHRSQQQTSPFATPIEQVEQSVAVPEVSGTPISSELPVVRAIVPINLLPVETRATGIVPSNAVPQGPSY